MQEKTTYRRTPKHYDGIRPTTHKMGDLLPHVLARIGQAYAERGDLILAAWPELIGPRMAPMTQAVSFSEGVLLVKVKNSPLYSVLIQERARILQNLKHQFPQTEIKNIFFRMG